MKKCFVPIIALILFSACTKVIVSESDSTNTEIISAPIPACYYPAVLVSTLAGSGTASNADGPIKVAGISAPMAMATFNDITYFSTFGRVRKIQGGTISTLYTYSSGPMGYFFVTSLATDYDGNIYAAYGNEYVVRKFNPAGGLLATYGIPGSSGYSNISPYLFRQISGIAVDADGRLYIADKNYVVRRRNADGTMDVVAGLPGVYGSNDGSISVARFGANIGAIAVSPYGDNIYVEDYTRIRIVTAGTVGTIAGSTFSGHVDGNGLSARFGSLADMTLDANGNLYVTDAYNSETTEHFFIRKIIRMTTGIIPWKVSTLAGGPLGYANGDGSVARFDDLWGITVNNGSLLVSDYSNNRIRKLNLTCAPVF